LGVLSVTSWHRIRRYYAVGVINTIFGYGIYSLLIFMGLTMYMAQAIGHIIGVSFNYFSYSKHVFQNTPASKSRFLVSYVLNYFIGLASITLSAQVSSSPYATGLYATLIISLTNFFILSRFVFPRNKNLAPKQSYILQENSDVYPN